MGAARQEASDALGESLDYAELVNAMDAARKNVLDIHAALQPFVEFALPEPTEEMLAAARGYWDITVLREQSGASDGRAGLWTRRRRSLRNGRANKPSI
jgi:uncharacterized membrane protein